MLGHKSKHSIKSGGDMSNTEKIDSSLEKNLDDISFTDLIKNNTPYFPSPPAWEDEVLYFLMLDRFSDGKEYGGFGDIDGKIVEKSNNTRSTSLFNDETDAENADRATWVEAGKGWCGGTINGLKDKLGYLKRMGVSAIWISPLFKQVQGSNDYHGYGIQNFLNVESRFGSRDDLVQMVRQAHKTGVRVILDIILNHAGDIYAYQGNYPYYYYNGIQWPIEGFRKHSGDPGSIRPPVDPSTPLNEAVWPVEFQDISMWTRQGEIRNWDNFPEYLDGDFMSLKNILLGYESKDPSYSWDLRRRIKEFNQALALKHLIEVYKFWMAFADIDGYRIDTVKHMNPGAVRIFVNAIHEFAQSLGKENFYLIGEVTGGRAHAVATVDQTGLDAALGIDDIQDKLEFLAKGYRNPGDPRTEDQVGYFDYFRNSILDDKHTHQWYAKHIVIMFDDHDQVGTSRKFRFCGQEEDSRRFLIPALGLNLTTMGIPCLYYGTEQAFNGADHRDGDDYSYSDIFLRECMFGGNFGSFQSKDRHFFNEENEIYQFLADLCKLRRDHITLRRGRQFLREVSENGVDGDYYYPQMQGGELHWVIAWSRIFSTDECLCAINTDGNQSLTLWATVDHELQKPGKQMQCIFSSEKAQIGSKTEVENRNGSSVKITVPATGFVIYR
jgi:glycosidase